MTESHPEPGAEPGGDAHERSAAEPELAQPRRSPGQRIAKLLALLLLALVVLYALFFHIFPWVERNVSNPSLDAAPTQVTTRS